MNIPVIIQRSDNHGFTLMETALALLVIGLAFLTLMGLGRSGLNAVKEANNDSRCEAMADAIFDTLDTYNYLFDDYARTNQQENTTWAMMWTDAPVPFPAVSGMATNLIVLEINKTGSNNKITLNTISLDEISAAYDPSRISLNNWNPRYQLIMIPSKTSNTAKTANIQNVILFIYPDGDTYSSDRRIYTTIINRPGVL